jgi:hypothetical protein
MATTESITINFSVPFNVSLQVGTDVIYYQDSVTSNVYRLGMVTAKTDTSITCEIFSTTPPPNDANDFIFFMKDNDANTSGIVGYHGTVDMEVTSTDKKELFAVNTEVFISS